MKSFLIVTNGTHFKIKYKFLFFWFFLDWEFWHKKKDSNYKWEENATFTTLENTIEFLKTNYGESYYIENYNVYSAAKMILK